MNTNQTTDRLVTFRAPKELVREYQAVVREREQSMSQALRLHMREHIEQKAKAA